MKSSTKTIWKTVVFSAAVLGGSVTLGCKKNDGKMTDPCADPCKDPCKDQGGGGNEYGGDEYGEGAWGEYDEEGRPRGEDGGGDVGRGFVLS